MLTQEELPVKDYEKATFAAGCFWGVEAVFRKVQGVDFTQVGYTGGDKENPTYKEVCMGDTGHAEAVELLFNPSIVPYKKLLELFWEMHDPTTPDRQGPDVGNQYRSAIFYHSEEQKNKALDVKKELEQAGRFRNPIVTQIVEAGPFYRAEEYHQQYFEKTGTQGGCFFK
jgi:peptide-methionine (S)-S-oxide reductase